MPAAALRAAEIKRQMEAAAGEAKRSRLENNGASPPFYTDGAPVVLITTLKKKQAEGLSEVSVVRCTHRPKYQTGYERWLASPAEGHGFEQQPNQTNDIDNLYLSLPSLGFCINRMWQDWFALTSKLYTGTIIKHF